MPGLAEPDSALVCDDIFDSKVLNQWCNKIVTFGISRGSPNTINESHECCQNSAVRCCAEHSPAAVPGIKSLDIRYYFGVGENLAGFTRS
jgi:hypothetical protein